MANPYLALAEEEDPKPPVAVTPKPEAAPAPPAAATPVENPYEKQVIIPVEDFEDQMDALIRDKKVPIGQLFTKARELGREINPKQESAFRDQVKGLRNGKYTGRLQWQHNAENTDTKALRPDDLPIQSATQADETSAVGSFVRGLNSLSFDLADDVAFGIRGAGEALVAGAENGGFKNFLSEDNRQLMKDTFDRVQQREHGWLQRQHQADEDFHNPAQTAGQATGIVGSMLIPMGAAARGFQSTKGMAAATLDATRVKNFMQAGKIAGVGALEGGAATIGGSEYGTKMDNAPIGTVIGATIAPVAAPLVKLTGAVAKRLAEVTGVAGSLRRVTPEIAAYANRMSDLTQKEINVMREKVQAFRRAGVDPNLNDVVPRKEQDRIRALARRDTKGRDAAYEGAEASRRDLGGNIRGQFDRVVNPDGTKASAAEWGERIKQRRDYDADRAMNTMRGKPVEFGVEIGDILGTRDGQRAWTEAIRSERDPKVRQTMEALPGIIRSTAQMNPAARAQVLKQTGGFTIGMADRLRRKLNDAGQAAQAQGKNDLAANMFQAAKDVASAARRAAPDYDAYLKNFSEDSTSLGAIKLGGQAFDRNTDEFVRKAVALGREQNAVHGVEAAANIQRGLKGRISNLTERTEWGAHTADVQYITPDGDTILVTMTIPPEGGNGIANLSIKKQGHGYGDEEAFNTIGPDEMRDLAMYAGQKWPWLESVTGQRVGGARERARREAMRARREAREAAEADVITEFDDGPRSGGIDFGDTTPRPRVARGGESTPEPAMRREPPPATSDDLVWESTADNGNGSYVRRSELPTGSPATNSGPSNIAGIEGLSVDATAEEIFNEFGPETVLTRSDIFDYLREYDPNLRINDPAVVRFADDVLEGWTRRRYPPTPAAPERASSFGQVEGFQPATTVDEAYERYVAANRRGGRDVMTREQFESNWSNRYDTSQPRDADGRYPVRSALESWNEQQRAFYGGDYYNAPIAREQRAVDDMEDALSDDFDELDDIEHAHMVDDINLENDGDINWVPVEEVGPPAGSVDPRAAGPAEDSLQQRLSELHDEWQEVRDSYSDGANEFPDFEQWLGLNFYNRELEQRLGASTAQIDAELPSFLQRLLRDEAGAKRLPARNPDAPNQGAGVYPPMFGKVANAPPTQNGLPSNAPPNLSRAATGPMNSRGVEPGASTRRRIDKLSPAILKENAQVPTHPTELDAPSDQMLAILQMRRALEAKMGESANGPVQMGNAMAGAPEQQARNAAILGEPVAQELQRGVAATMIKHGNAMRASPAHGSSTAMNVQDDANLGNIAGVALDVGTGNKVGLAKRAIEGLSKLGMRDVDVENIVTRALDDSQVDQLIDELERSIPNPAVAREIVKAIREAGTRAVGMAVSEAYPAEEQ